MEVEQIAEISSRLIEQMPCFQTVARIDRRLGINRLVMRHICSVIYAHQTYDRVIPGVRDEKPEHKASRIVHIDIERYAQILCSPKKGHEQTVAIYDLLDDNSFALKEDRDQGLIRGYRLHLKTDFRHVYFDVRDEDDTVLNGFGMALGPFRRIISGGISYQ